MDGAFIIPLALSLFFGAAAQSHIGQVLKVLRVSHTQKWKELGSLSFYSSTVSNNFIFLKFLFTNQYMELEGADFHKLCCKTKFFLCSFFVSFVISIVFLNFRFCLIAF